MKHKPEIKESRSGRNVDFTSPRIIIIRLSTGWNVILYRTHWTRGRRGLFSPSSAREMTTRGRTRPSRHSKKATRRIFLIASILLFIIALFWPASHARFPYGPLRSLTLPPRSLGLLFFLCSFSPCSSSTSARDCCLHWFASSLLCLPLGTPSPPPPQPLAPPLNPFFFNFPKSLPSCCYFPCVDWIFGSKVVLLHVSL